MAAIIVSIVMKRTFVFLLLCAAAAAAQPGPPAAGARSVYLLPMGHGLEQFLANHLASSGAFQVVTDPALADDLKTILDKGNVSMDQLQAILKDAQVAGTHLSAVSEALANEAQDLPGLVLQAQQTLQELKRLIEGIEKVWPIRSHIEQRQSSTRIPPSEVVP